MTRGRDHRVPAQVLEDALAQELRLVEELRHALQRRREGIATTDADGFDIGMRIIARTQLALDEARRSRAALVGMMTGVPGTSLDALGLSLEGPLPEGIAAMREAIQRAMASVTHEVELYRRALGTARQAEAAYLQGLFSGESDPERPPSAS